VVASGARRDLGQEEAAVAMLQVRELTQDEPWSARLRYAYADALLGIGRGEEAREWFARAAEVDDDAATDAAERLLELDGVQLDEDEDEDEEEDLDAETDADVDIDAEDDEDDYSETDEDDEDLDAEADEDDVEIDEADDEDEDDATDGADEADDEGDEIDEVAGDEVADEEQKDDGKGPGTDAKPEPAG
jgi:hypothetical protein